MIHPQLYMCIFPTSDVPAGWTKQVLRPPSNADPGKLGEALDTIHGKGHYCVWRSGDSWVVASAKPLRKDQIAQVERDAARRPRLGVYWGPDSRHPSLDGKERHAPSRTSTAMTSRSTRSTKAAKHTSIGGMMLFARGVKKLLGLPGRKLPSDKVEPE
ncbi:hypothetical protein QBC46DRAFT_19644 [Diplogelasinospora grovesii]|uniref:Uncharacterized protein n=1 Tax=Diplogelasinospora grovesii TaxID=303347 RepID=A0AAN6N2G9_9PEZI|nr:hypothetical protein QBC46DRAFT_19644 [Diplogelasinospora grovesii]